MSALFSRTSTLTYVLVSLSIILTGCVTAQGINSQAAANVATNYETAKRNGLKEEQCRYARAAADLFLRANDDQNLMKWRSIATADCALRAVESENSGRIGVQLAQIPRDVQHRLERNRGVYVAAVTVDSPAHRADIRTGDVITAVNGKEVVDLKDLGLLQVEAKRACDSKAQLRVSVMRDAATSKELSVVICK
jgi:membrane-associated protease RseP (regulator of RpoE activity)